MTEDGDPMMLEYLRQQIEHIRTDEELRERTPKFVQTVLPALINIKREAFEKQRLRETKLMEHPMMNANTKHRDMEPLLTLRQIKCEHNHIWDKGLRSRVDAMTKHAQLQLKDPRFNLGTQNAMNDQYIFFRHFSTHLSNLNNECKQGYDTGRYQKNVVFDPPNNFAEIEDTLIHMHGMMNPIANYRNHIIWPMRGYRRYSVHMLRSRHDRKK